MGLIDITPIDQTDAYSFGYAAGQRTAHATTRLRGGALTRTGLRLWSTTNRVVALDRTEFMLGFVDGYSDECNGLASPLPRTVIAYRIDEID